MRTENQESNEINQSKSAASVGDCRSEIVPGATDDGRDWHVGADSIKMPLDNLNRRQAMNRGATWVVLVPSALIAGCNKSDPALLAKGAIQADAVKGAKGPDAGIEPAEATEEKPVVEIDLSGSKVTDAVLAYVARFPRALRSLLLKDTAVTSAGMAQLRGLVSLETLDLAGTKIGDEGLSKIDHLAGLTELYLPGTAVTDAGMASVAKLNGLTKLILSDTAVGDAGVGKMKTLTDLKELQLDRTKLTNAGLEQLKISAVPGNRLCDWEGRDARRHRKAPPRSA